MPWRLRKREASEQLCDRAPEERNGLLSQRLELSDEGNGLSREKPFELSRERFEPSGEQNRSSKE